MPYGQQHRAGTDTWEPKRPHKHQDLAFWFQGPISGAYQRRCFVGSLCLRERARADTGTAAQTDLRKVWLQLLVLSYFAPLIRKAPASHRILPWAFSSWFCPSCSPPTDAREQKLCPASCDLEPGVAKQTEIREAGRFEKAPKHARPLNVVADTAGSTILPE